ncbi:glycosyltransferase [Flavisolibacter ginsenosidimutans]|uniref:Glycosyltransferase family 4 protein n=1 Tax=Flavisolibacter ginsenosidimutans TaxID=661481 RepID=A0A5B8UE96_9BACT|nr:glycosyltransferase [Flavisolibacter ginsenosidimutans]QEC54894.1 glycosyltransferase family 4 protein [Flavisolibacter ginsenosidimutans]
MKKVLIVSPYFPPFNTADMQRVRQTLPYLREMGWEPTVLTVDEKYVDAYSTDPLLLQTIPNDIKIEKVNALKGTLTRRFGIGSLSLRAFFSMRNKGDELFQKQRFDLVYFSTTAFHVMALGPHWKKKFGVPFILDIQDPWYNTYYFNNALSKKTLKARLFHRLDKYLEEKTLPFADGIISVSAGYEKLYLQRYSTLQAEQFCVIPFGCAELDFPIAKANVSASRVRFPEEHFNMVYIGRGGQDMTFASGIIFDAVKMGLQSRPDVFSKLHLWFIGTSYAQAGEGKKTIEPIAHQKGLANLVTEVTDRLPYFETLHLLDKANLLFMPGSTDPTYTASKVYPYIYLNKPLLAVFHEKSSVCEIIGKTSAAKVVPFTDAVKEEDKKKMTEDCYHYFLKVISNQEKTAGFNRAAFEEYTAKAMTAKQVDFFNRITAHFSFVQPKTFQEA